MTPGNYYCETDAVARTLLNCPLNTAFILKVEYGNGYGYIRQTFKQNVTNAIITRSQNSSSPNYNAWSDDISYVTNNDFGYIMCSVTTQANAPVEIPNAPSERYGYIPVMVGHKSANNVQETVFYDTSKWWIMSTVSQDVYIAFYKIPY